MHAPRYLQSGVTDALKRKKVFIGGPRQVGKTTFALRFLGKDADESHSAYLNWDHPSVRRRLRRAELPAVEPLLLLDEIHKYSRWLGGQIHIQQTRAGSQSERMRLFHAIS